MTDTLTPEKRESLRTLAEATAGPYGMDGDVPVGVTPNEVLAILSALDAAIERAEKAEKQAKDNWDAALWWERAAQTKATDYGNLQSELTALKARVEELEALSAAMWEFTVRAAQDPCETEGVEDLEPGCCRTCRARTFVEANESSFDAALKEKTNEQG